MPPRLGADVMQFTYTLQYRDQLEAAGARFPGDSEAARSAAARPPAAVMWLVILGLTCILLLLVSRSPALSRATVPAAAATEDASAEPLVDPMEHPVFGVGALISAMGGAIYVIPLAYVLGIRRSARPVHDAPATARIDDQGLTIQSASKEFALAWDGVVAVAEMPRSFVIKTVGDLRLVLPKRALEAAEDVEALRQKLRRHVPPMAGVVPW